MYRDYIEADGVYQDAQRSNQCDHGWDFRPDPKPEENASGFWIIVLAVGLVLFGMAACLAVEVVS